MKLIQLVKTTALTEVVLHYSCERLVPIIVRHVNLEIQLRKSNLEHS